MIHGKRKAVTFSYDDGVTQDKRLIRLFDKYDLKCTFNLNSGLLGRDGELIRDGVRVTHIKNKPKEVRALYDGHEIAVHTLTHPTLTDLTEERIIHEVEDDRVALSELCGYEVVGMAYPNGPNDDRVAGIIREHTGVKYVRTVLSTGNFARQTNLYRFNPTVYHHREFDKLLPLAEQFLADDSEEDCIFYIWGHGYEFDIRDDWGRFEEFLRVISGQRDVFYGTNAEVLLNCKTP